MHDLTADLIRQSIALSVAALEWDEGDVADIELRKQHESNFDTIIKQINKTVKKMKGF